ncbi:Gfo/Idh/MocA family protein [Gemmatimonadota bacterium]
MDNRCRIAIVGVGRYGRRLLDAFLKATPVDAVMLRKNSPNLEYVRECSPETTIFHSLEDLLINGDFCAAIVATPIDTHFDIGMRMLASGKHLFIEKPPARTAKECLEMFEAANRKGLVCHSGYKFLYNDCFKRLVMLTGKSDPLYVSLQWHKWGTFDEDILLNLLSHELSLLYTLVSGYVNLELVTSPGGNRIILIAKQEGRIIGDIVVNRVSTYYSKMIYVHAPERTYLLANNENLYLLNDGKREFIMESKNDMLVDQALDFLGAIKNKGKTLVDHQLAMQITRSIEGLKNSILT